MTWTQRVHEEIMRERHDRKLNERLEELEDHDCWNVIGSVCPCADQCECLCGKCGFCR